LSDKFESGELLGLLRKQTVWRFAMFCASFIEHV
jgi:hypothetical protein